MSKIKNVQRPFFVVYLLLILVTFLLVLQLLMCMDFFFFYALYFCIGALTFACLKGCVSQVIKENIVYIRNKKLSSSLIWNDRNT